MKWWVAVLIASGTTLYAAYMTPRALTDLAETRALEMDGATTVGQVVKHQSHPSRRRCNTAALVRYEVASGIYFVWMQGCGAEAAVLPVGSVAEVTYVRSNPAMARASADDAVTYRFEALGLFFLWIAGPAAGVVAWRMRLAQRRLV